MGAIPSRAAGVDQGETRRAYNNQQDVQAMLAYRARAAQGGASGTTRVAQCPIAHDAAGAHRDELNPLNNIPHLAQAAAPNQTELLSTERVVSSIPRAPTSAGAGGSPYDAPGQCPVPHGAAASGCPVDHNGKDGEQPEKWEYPSPQQFYNALARKGWETPEENVDMMVLIHNFLNERAWQEVVEWEKLAGSDPSALQLARFQGRPGTLSPRARLFGWLGWAMPDKFSVEPPFDRHDWVVRRAPTGANAQGAEVRYVIDYYSTPDDTDENEASFHLDVRPAIDSLDAVRMRWKRAMEEYEAGTLFAPFVTPEPAAAS